MKQQERTVQYLPDIHIGSFDPNNLNNIVTPSQLFGVDTVLRRAEVEKPAMSKEEFLGKLGDDTLYRWVHVPYSMVEVVWDYLDSCCDISASRLSRMPEVKKEMRRLKEFHKEVDYDHKCYLTKSACPWDVDDAVKMQDVFRPTFATLNECLVKALGEQHSFSDKDDKKLFWACAYIAYMVCESVIRYCKVFRQKFYQQYRVHIKDILCKSFYETAKELKSLVDMKPLKFEDGHGCSEWIDKLVDELYDIQFMDNKGVLERKLV